jgi:hypothetical protein
MPAVDTADDDLAAAPTAEQPSPPPVKPDAYAESP